MKTFDGLEGVEILLHPFQGGVKAFEPMEGGGYIYTYALTQYDVDILKRAIGDVADIRGLEAFLRMKCGFMTAPVLHWLKWPELVAAVELALDDEQAKAAEPIPTATDGKTMKTKPPKEPSKIANETYLLYTSMGITQEDVAAELTEKYKPAKPYTQCQVSRWVRQVRAYREAVGLPVDNNSGPKGRMISADPSRIE